MSQSNIQQRNSYDTVLKHLARENLLPQTYLDKIDRTLIWRWKNMSAEKFTGYELSVNAKYHYETIKEFAHDVNAQRIFRAYTRVIKTFQNIAFSCTDFKRKLKENKEVIVDVIQQATHVIGDKISLRIFNITSQTFRHWLRISKVKCHSSFLHWCKKSYPHQLTNHEVGNMKSLLLDPLYAHWPIASLSWFALRNNIVKASVHSWYRYASLLGIKRPKPTSRRKKTKLGIRAKKVGEIIHADVTKFQLPNNIIAYIYIVIDNFSRCILACKAEIFLSAKAMKETLIDARNKLPKNIEPILITDNGSENVLAHTIEPKFQSHLHAQTDIDFSNSMVEAVNKILKYSYLYTHEITDISNLKNTLTNAVKDYNEIRPHYSLKGLTPLECFEGKESKMINANQKLITARNERLKDNKNTKCKGC